MGQQLVPIPIHTPSNATAGTLYYYCMVSGTCSPAATSNVSGAIVVNPSPTAYAVTGGGTTCITGTGSPVGLSNSQTGVNYQLYLGASPVGSPVAGTGAAIAFGNQTTGGTYTVTAAMASGSACPVTMTGSAVVTITPSPTTTFTYSSYTFCATGSSTAATLSGAPTSGTFSASPGGLNFTSTTTGVLNLATSTPGTYSITYTVAATGGCAAYTYNQPTNMVISALPIATISYSGSPYCSNAGTASVTQSGQAGGTYSSTAGLSINSSTGDVNLSASTAGTYTVTYSFSNGTCSGTTTASITITAAPSATITYSGSPFCATTASGSVNRTGTSGGIYSASPGGLTISSTTGTITPTTSTPGTYTVTYTVAAAGGCALYSTTISVTINALPTATISYAGSPYCSTSGTASVTQTGQTGGSYSSTGGLSINSGTGDVNLSASTPGSYTVSYTIASAGGCAVVVKTTNITITTAPSATISYGGSPFCSTTASVSVTRTGTTGGTYSSTAGLFISSTTGTITPSSSTPGTYTVTYTIAAAGGCALYSTTASVTINALPAATISYGGSPYCTTSGTATVTQTGQTGGTYSSTGGLSINSGTGNVNLSASTAGTYTVSYTIVASGGCAAVVKTASVTVTATPLATISYSGTPFCTNSGTVSVTRTGTSGGSYSASPGGLSISSSTGTITPSGSTAGTYTVTYTVAASGGCALYSTTTSVTINPVPTAGAITGASKVCIGSLITLVPNAGGTGPFTYSWSSSITGVATVDNAGNVTGKGAGSTNITYTVTDANSCTSVKSSNFQVTVTQPIANAITQASNLSSVCMNSTLQLTSNATAVTGSPIYAWSSSNTAVATVDNTGLVTGVAAGTTNITYTVTDGNGCVSAISPNYAATVVQIPTGNITSTSATSPTTATICAGGSITFTAPAGYPSYLFKVGGTTVQTGVSSTYSSTILTNGASVTVDVSNSLNCGTTFGPIVITVNPLPTPTLGVDKSTACFDDNVTFTAGGGTNYTFKVGVNPVQSGGSNKYITNTLAVGNNSVTVDVTDGNSCTATSTAVAVLVNPVSTGTLSPTPASMCVGETKTFIATTGFNNYVFNVGATSVQGPGASNTFDYTPGASGGNIITVNAKNSYGCATTFNAAVVNVNALPTGTLATTESSGGVNDNTICAGAPVTFTVTPTAGNTYSFYLNGTGAALQTGTSNKYVSTTLANANSITVVVSNPSSCQLTLTSPTIAVIQPPVGSLNVSPTNTICAGDNVTFTADAGFTNYRFILNATTTLQNGTGNTFQTTALKDGDI